MTNSPDHFLPRLVFQALAVGALLASMAFAAGLALLGGVIALPVIIGLGVVRLGLAGWANASERARVALDEVPPALTVAATKGRFKSLPEA